MKGMNIIQLNTLHLNVVLLNGDEMPGEVVVGGGEVVPVPPTEPETPDVPDVPVEPKKFILSASVANGVVSATLNGVVVSLPFTANEGDTIVLEVTPNDGYTFEGWADGNTDNPRTITMNADVVLSAQCVEVVVPPAKDYIQFEDAEVERVLMSKGVSSDGVGITIEDAEKVTSIGTWFYGNTAIESFDELDYFTGVTSISSNAFNGCANLQKLVFRYAVPPTLGASAFANTSFPIYVPDASLEAYKTATNWNTYADRIHPLSEIEGSLIFYDKLVGDGTAYINTEYYPSSWDNVEWDADKPNSYNRQMFGEKSSALSIANLVYSATQTYYCYKLTVSTNLINEDNTGRQHRMLRIVDLGGGTYRREVADLILGTSNTIEASWSGKDATATQSLRVFGSNKSDGAMEKIYNGAIRSLIITDARTNEVKLNLKPCTWNGEAGMWDEIGNKFYGNAATSGEFSVANDE